MSTLDNEPETRSLFNREIELDDEGNGIIRFSEEEAESLGLTSGATYELFLDEDEDGEVTVRVEMIDEQ